MSAAASAEELVRQGRLSEALDALKDRVRADPSDAALRVFLFQIQCVFGDWDRALTALNVAAELDATNLLMAQVGRAALECEALRAEVFAGRRSPLFLGRPPDWVGPLLQAHELTARGEDAAAQPLRADALEAAPATSGTIATAGADGDAGEPVAFEWIADADSRLGPLLEVIVDGRYYWVPFENIATIEIEAPADLRDLVWAPVDLTWSNGGATVGLIPVRYAGSETDADDAIRMARKSEWLERAGGAWIGRGQRVLTTDAADYPLLEVRRVELATRASEDSGDGDADRDA